MFPHVIEIGSFYLPTYGLLFAAGVLVAWWWLSRRGRSLGVADVQMFNLCFYTLLGGILGAKLLLTVVDFGFYVRNPEEILGPFPLPGTVAGAVLGLGLGLRVRASAAGPRRGRAATLAWAVPLGAFVGAKLQLILLDGGYYLQAPERLLGSLIRSAGVLVGGVIGGAVVFVLYARRHGLPVLRLGDAIAAPLALSQSIGRLGCFAAGCCYGKPTDAWWGLTFTDPRATLHTGVPLNVPLVPTQLIQMANDLLLALLLSWMWRRRLEPPGTVFWWYVLLYGLTRGLIEFWRGDATRGLFFDGLLSTSQLFSLAGIAFGAVMLLRGRPERRQTATA